MERATRAERTGWRDQSLSERHRRWGWNCPAVDLDFPMVEYDSGKVVALVEYKNEHAAPQKASHPTYQALCDLAERANIPFLVARYADDFSWFKAVPLNNSAKHFLPETQQMTEHDFVALLYRMRGREMPPGLLERGAIEI